MKIPIVNEKDEILYFKDRSAILDNEICRVTCLWITDTKGNVLLAKRAPTKKRHPNKWAAAVAGTVEEGETYEENIYKEAKEELGLEGYALKGTIPELIKTEDYVFYGQQFFLTLPEGYSRFVLEDMVSEIKWFAFSEVEKWFEENPNDFVPSMENVLNQAKKYYENKN